MTNSLTSIGTATTLARLGRFTLLTDPNFLHRGHRAYLGKGLWSRRLTDPAIQVDDVPVLDAVILSHLHGDHFDRVARRGFTRTAPLITTRPAAERLQQQRRQPVAAGGLLQPSRHGSDIAEPRSRSRTDQRPWTSCPRSGGVPPQRAAEVTALLASGADADLGAPSARAIATFFALDEMATLLAD